MHAFVRNTLASILVFVLLTQCTTQASKDRLGEFSVTYNNQVYDVYVVDPRTESIRMHWLALDGSPLKNLNATLEELRGKGLKARMITNGGMYHAGNLPQGLFIADGKTLRPVDTARGGSGNFYIEPNGVFYIDKGGAHVLTTQAFKKKHGEKPLTIIFATQSGPMLVHDDVINNHFNPDSENGYIRSGVGILRNGNVVFAISRSDTTTFHQFATLFKNRFECKDALYLDGAISKMYLPALRPDDTGGDFGVMISVTGKTTVRRN